MCLLYLGFTSGVYKQKKPHIRWLLISLSGTSTVYGSNHRITKFSVIGWRVSTLKPLLMLVEYSPN